MPSNNKIQIMLFQKLCDNLFAEDVGCTPVVWSPSFCFYSRNIASISSRWICPQQITQQAFLWNFLRPLNIVYLLNLLQVWRNTPMHTQNLILNQCCDRQIIEQTYKLFPKFDRIAPFTLVPKTVYSRNSLAFVVAS